MIGSVETVKEHELVTTHKFCPDPNSEGWEGVLF